MEHYEIELISQMFLTIVPFYYLFFSCPKQTSHKIVLPSLWHFYFNWNIYPQI